MAGHPGGRSTSAAGPKPTPCTWPARGWDTTGIDFAPEAITAARKKADDAGVRAEFVAGDASRLADAGVRAPFDLLLDIGCYHTIPAGRRDAYVAGAVQAARPGADLYLAGIAAAAAVAAAGAPGVPREIRTRFGPYFRIAGQQRTGPLVAYHLVRHDTQTGSGDAADQRVGARLSRTLRVASRPVMP